VNAQALILSLVALFLLSSCDKKQNNYVKPSSPLYSMQPRLTGNQVQDKAIASKASDYILTELPRGSSEAAVLQFICKHLSEVHRKPAAYEFPQPYICVRTSEWHQFPVGGGGTEIVFQLDRSRRLTDVRVYAEETTL
jgi:hypothetical protein